LLRRFIAGNVQTDQLPPELQAMVTSDAPRAYVCAGRSCAAPVNDAIALERLLVEFRGG
jgi:uncharacterized protein YyaL (SSP411 family)